MIKFNYEDKDYTLTFTRATAKYAESRGLKLDEDFFDNMPLTAIDTLLICSFKANHPTIKDEKALEIADKLGNKGEVIANLLEDYAETYKSLLSEPKGKNLIKWESQ